jgi:hypothetical protein
MQPISNNTNDIYNDEYLTEEEDNSEEKDYGNFYKFLITQLKNNLQLKNYLYNVLGLIEKEDLVYLDANDIQDIYNLLNENGKLIMKKNYLEYLNK